MIDLRRAFAPAALGIVLLLIGAGCSKPQSQTTTSTPEPAASAVAQASPAAAETPPQAATSAEPGASGIPEAPTPQPTASPVPNLLDVARGTIVRAYNPSLDSPAVAVGGFSVPDNDAGPWTFVYELPGVATLSRASAKLQAKTDKGEGANITFAISTTSATSGFSDIGTIASAATDDEQSVSLSAPRARWVRVTVSRTGAVRPANAFAVYGAFAPAAPLPIAGTYVQYEKPYANGTFASAPSTQDPWYLRVAVLGPGGVNGEQCFNGHLGDSYPGTLDGRTWSWKRSDTSGAFVANDERTLLVGTQGPTTYWVRSSDHPKYCEPIVVGTGRDTVLVLESPSWSQIYPADPEWIANAPSMRFEQIGASMLDQSMLDRASTVWLDGLCKSDDMLSAGDDVALVQWIAAGHKLLVTDADMCNDKTHYAMMPYQFVSDNPGARGAKGDRLIQVEDDVLGTSDKTDKAHVFDPQPWVQGGNQLGDANTVTTQDPHWCGHLFGTNANHVNGFMQMYTTYGRGLIIYDGFDHDDDNNPEYQRVRRLELAAPVPPDLPCTEKASLGFVIQPDRDGKFAPGKAATLPFAMELLANQGWKGHVNVTTSGDFPGTVTPSSFDVSGGTQPLKIAVRIPQSAKPGTYAIIVNGDGGNGQTAQATIHLHADVSLVKQIKAQRRIRIYGIHFDVDKATIKPQSEPVIAQIAAVMKQNPAWRFRVEGHTDSDGGLAHNGVLSQQRAESVVADLVKRYHIARSRLVPKGFGYSKPVAPNTTAAGKALNRRVELYLLNP